MKRLEVVLMDDPFDIDISSIVVRNGSNFHLFYIASDYFLDNLLFV
jgi:hypothetical protein